MTTATHIAADLNDLPGQVWRIIGQLPDGRIRYESRDGIQTGWQRGQHVVRDALAGWNPSVCFHCGRLTNGYASMVMVDNLCARDAECAYLLRSNAELAADEVARWGDRLPDEWWCATNHADAAGRAILSFREWRGAREGGEDGE